ncbi:MAG: 6-phosphogluconolactonase, partial [Bacteroidia bacterium]
LNPTPLATWGQQPRKPSLKGKDAVGMTKVHVESLARRGLLHSFPDRATLNAALAEAMSHTLQSAIAENQRASVAFSGGSTPAPMLQQLSAAAINWKNLSVTLVDERWVETSHVDSNEAQLRKSLIHGAASALTFIGLKADHPTPEKALATVNRHLDALSWPLDCVHLGMGSDGHTASWFADADEYARAINPTHSQRVVALNPHAAPHPRISLSASAILTAKSIFLHITGDEKLEVLKRAVNGDKTLPIAVALSTATPVNIYWAP